MAHHYGDLLVGGAILRHLDLDLELDQQLPGSSDYLLSGRLSLSPTHHELLQCGRRYRLQLEDGRAGCVIVSRVELRPENDLVVEFEPLAVAAAG